MTMKMELRKLPRCYYCTYMKRVEVCFGLQDVFRKKLNNVIFHRRYIQFHNIAFLHLSFLIFLFLQFTNSKLLKFFLKNCYYYYVIYLFFVENTKQ